MNATRTYDRETYQRLVTAWADYGPEWTAVRELCALAGYPFPPAGALHDEREDEPSQRSIVWRALDYRPLRTLDVIRTSRSWSEVVRKIMGDEDRLREDAIYRARDDDWNRGDEPTARESTRLLGTILDRIRDSTP